MQVSQVNKYYNEIDLNEFFITIWAYKFFIFFTFIVGIILGGAYYYATDKKYTSEAIFQINSSRNQNLNFGGDLAALVSIANFGDSTKTNTLPIDKINGRLFIESIEDLINFKDDIFFNDFDSSAHDPFWKKKLKILTDTKKTTSKSVENEAIWQKIKKVYAENILISVTSNGSSKITVTHTDPDRAALIANTIMDKIINDLKNTNDQEQDDQLKYLANTLGNALSDLEASQSKLKTFTLENSALPLESFAKGSLQLELLREQSSRTNELFDAVSELSELLQKNTTTQKDYQILRKKFPIVDQVEFRRVLGQNEIISSWSWPTAYSTKAVLATLLERKNKLKSQIEILQVEAARSREALSIYSKLERESQIAEATYTVLIEQVKAQSIAAGYRPNQARVYEFATPSISPSTPSILLFVSLGAILGFFIGCILSLILDLRKNVYRSKKHIISSGEAEFNLNLRPLNVFQSRSFEKMKSIQVKKSFPSLRDLAIEINNSGNNTFKILTSSKSKIKSTDLAKALAIYMQTNDKKIGIVSFSQKNSNSFNENIMLSNETFIINENWENISMLTPNHEMNVIKTLSDTNFVESLKIINKKFDLMFLCADDADSFSLLRALQSENNFHITLTKTRCTKSDTLPIMRSISQIQGLLYD